MVSRYENASYAFGPDSTFFWLRHYEEFLEFKEGEDEEEVWTGLIVLPSPMLWERYI